MTKPCFTNEYSSLCNYSFYSTLSKIAQFLLVESSNFDPKLHFEGVFIAFPWKLQATTAKPVKFERFDSEIGQKDKRLKLPYCRMIFGVI